MSIQPHIQTKAMMLSFFTPVSSDLLQRKCICGNHTIISGECSDCRKKREGIMQRAAISAVPVNAVPPIVHEVLSSSGQQLNVETRAFMEPRFGHDFSGVRVHTDAKAAASAHAVNALAYTVGRDIVFGMGQYAPGTNEGKHLLAHELTHVIQQQGTARIQCAKAEENHNEDLDEAIAIVQIALDSASSLTKSSKGEEGDLTTSVVDEDQIQILQNALSNLLAKGSDKVDEDQIQILQNALNNLLALKGSDKVDEIWGVIKAILSVAKSGEDIEKNLEMQRKGSEGEEEDVFESEAELVAHRVMKGEMVGEPTYQVSNRYSGAIVQRLQPEPVREVVEASRQMPHPAGKLALLVVAGIVLLGYEIYRAVRERPVPLPTPVPVPRPVPLPTPVPVPRPAPELPRPPKEKEDSNDCRHIYPNIDECWWLEITHNYEYADRDLKSARETAFASLKRENRSAQLESFNVDRTSEEGPCSDLGTHTNVRDLNRPAEDNYFGSIVCCPCCLDEETGPELEARCGFVPS